MSSPRSGSWMLLSTCSTADSVTGASGAGLMRLLGSGMIPEYRRSLRRVKNSHAPAVAQAPGELENSRWTCYNDRVIGPDDFRRALGHFATGVTVVATVDDDGRPTGLTANAVSSVSLDPPLVLVCVSQHAHCYSCFRPGGKFAVNILASDQEALARRFASSSLTGAQKFEGVGYREGELRIPLV